WPAVFVMLSYGGTGRRLNVGGWPRRGSSLKQSRRPAIFSEDSASHKPFRLTGLSGNVTVPFCLRHYNDLVVDLRLAGIRRRVGIAVLSAVALDKRVREARTCPPADGARIQPASGAAGGE